MMEEAKIVSSREPAVGPLPPSIAKPSAPRSKDTAKHDESDSSFAVSVTDVYEGPLDLLLDLIRKQDIDIYDIPIAKITAQYLAYVEKIRELDVNVAAEFIYMAAVLIHIKSKMLLPRDPTRWRVKRKIRATNWLTGCSNMRSSSRRRRCFYKSSRLKMQCFRIHR